MIGRSFEDCRIHGLPGYDAWKLATPPEYEISAEEEQELYELEQEERERAEQEAREEAEAEAWLASRPWWWHTYKSLAWRLYWAPRRWFLTNTAIGRRYLDWKIDRDYERRGLHNLVKRRSRLRAYVRGTRLGKRFDQWRWERQLRRDSNDEVPF